MKMEYDRYFLPSCSCWYGNLGSSRRKSVVCCIDSHCIISRCHNMNVCTHQCSGPLNATGFLRPGVGQGQGLRLRRSPGVRQAGPCCGGGDGRGLAWRCASDGGGAGAGGGGGAAAAEDHVPYNLLDHWMVGPGPVSLICHQQSRYLSK